MLVPALFLNGLPQAVGTATPQQLLASRPGGVYTTMLLTQDGRVADYGLHKERLARWAGGCLLKDHVGGLPPTPLWHNDDLHLCGGPRSIMLVHETRGSFPQVVAWLQVGSLMCALYMFCVECVRGGQGTRGGGEAVCA